MFKTLKEILQKNKQACIIIVENEKPVLVINSFEEYQKTFGQKVSKEESPAVKDFMPKRDSAAKKDDEAVLEEVNNEIIGLQNPHEHNIQTIEDFGDEFEEPEEIRVEDIPLV